MSRRGRALLNHIAIQDGASVFRRAVNLGGQRQCFRCGKQVLVRRKKGRWHAEAHLCWHGKPCRRPAKGGNRWTPHYTMPDCVKCRENKATRGYDSFGGHRAQIPAALVSMTAGRGSVSDTDLVTGKQKSVNPNEEQ